MALMMGTLTKPVDDMTDYRKRLSDIRTDLSWVEAMLGVIVAGVAALVVRTFFG